MLDRHLLGCWVLLAVMLGTLAVTVPRHAGPDEPAHAVRAAGLVRGQVFGRSTEDVASRSFDVPSWADQPEPACFAFDEDRPAGCATVVLSGGDRRLQSTAASYPPAAHLIPGLGTVLLDDARALWLARLLGVGFSAWLLAWSLCVLRRQGQYLMIAATLLALSPAAMFTIVVINPSGFAVVGSVATMSGAVMSAQGVRSGRWLFAIGAATLALTRSDGWLWAGAVVALALLAARCAPRMLAIQLGRGPTTVAATAVAGSVLWTALVRPELVEVPTALGGEALVGEVLRRTTDHLDEAVSLFGWLDTRIPTIALYLWWLAVGVLAGRALEDRGGRRLAAVAAAGFGGFVAIGWLADLITAGDVGLVWQGRYALPILVAGLMATGIAEPPTRLTAWVTASVAAAVWVVGFYQAFRRWSVGASGPMQPWEWQRGGSAIHPAASLVVFAGAAVAILVVLFRLDRARVDVSGAEAAGIASA